MPTLFDPQARSAIHARLDALQPERAPAWGRFSAPEMVTHLACALRAGLGELPTGSPKGALATTPLNLLVIYVLPWPRGKAVSPSEFLGVPPGPWREAIATLHDLVERTGHRGPAGAWPVSPVFGRISGRTWGVLQYKHLDHHLCQFGV
jgi:hypothetical protein